MFIYSVRASTLKFFGVVGLCAVLLITLGLFSGRGTVAAAGDADTQQTVSYTGIKTNEDRIAFLASFGYTVKETVVEEETFVIPDEFDRVLVGYNEIQKSQGLDLSRYQNKKVTRYTYEVTGYPDYQGTVWANLIVYRGRVIAADISSADPRGFVHGLSK